MIATPSIRQAFIEQFGEQQAQAIEAAANRHQNGVHDNRGSDPFKWTLLICIGYECMEVDAYRQDHGITVPWADLKAWIIEHADLGSHDGDCDYLAAFCGRYAEFFGAKE